MLAAAPAFAGSGNPIGNSMVPLRNNWALQSSCLTQANGGQISTSGFNAQSWHAATIPTTVVAALVTDKSYPDPYIGMNLRTLPGVDYPIGEMFANFAMPPGSPFKCSWWFRTEFSFHPAGKKTWLHFDGINYRASVWFNGRKIADSKAIAGTFRQFEFEISSLLRNTGLNSLAVEVFAPEPDDLAITFVDWNPLPPDKNMGLWRDVYLTTAGDVSLRHPFVESRLDSNFASAELTIRAELHNSSRHSIRGVFQVDFEGKQVKKIVDLPPQSQKEIELTARQHRELEVPHVRLWWPARLGRPDLYKAKLSFVMAEYTSDSTVLRFGIRKVSSEITPEGYRLFRINGRPILIRGAGWTSDMLQRFSLQRMETELKYAQDIGLNTIRLEGQLERDDFFDMTDRMGILVIAGWSCCNAWERWPEWRQEQYQIAEASLIDQVRRLRNHPSILAWFYGSDMPPPSDVEKLYLRLLSEQHWPNPSLSSASQNPASLTGNSGVKMLGPYDYVPPNYWYTDKEAGGAYGFNTETGPGPAIPSIESLRHFLPDGHLWPIDEQWNYHSGSKRFNNINHFAESLNQRYGPAGNLEDFLRKSQAMSYESERAMFEAYARNKYHATGVIHWMLNNAWPSLIWHLYDYYLVPAGGYFGAKKACEPVHAQYSYDDRTIVVINDSSVSLSSLKLTARIFDLHSRQLFERKVFVTVPGGSVVTAFGLPSHIEGLTTTYFLQLQLAGDSGEAVSENFYWLSIDPDVMDWTNRIGTAYTPQSAYANLRDLATLPDVNLKVNATTQSNGLVVKSNILLRNPNQELAFMAHLRLTEGNAGQDITPVFWQDNYISLMPGEEREIAVKYQASSRQQTHTVLQVSGWNIKPTYLILSSRLRNRTKRTNGSQ